jgi:hypothetical protein
LRMDLRRHEGPSMRDARAEGQRSNRCRTSKRRHQRCGRCDVVGSLRAGEATRV